MVLYKLTLFYPKITIKMTKIWYDSVQYFTFVIFDSYTSIYIEFLTIKMGHARWAGVAKL